MIMAKLDLEAVQKEFANWRASRAKVGKIPQYLWEQVWEIVDDYSTGEITKSLGLSGSQISAKRKEISDINKNSPASNFLELTLPQCTPYSGLSVIAHNLQLKRPDGMTLIIEQLSEQMVLQVLNDFSQVV